MKRIISILVLITVCVFANTKSEYTIVLKKTDNIQSAKNYMSNTLFELEDDIRIIHYQNSYLVVFNSYLTWMSANKKLQSFSNSLKSSRPYILAIKNARYISFSKTKKTNKKVAQKRENNIVETKLKASPTYSNNYEVIVGLKYSPLTYQNDFTFGTDGTKIDSKETLGITDKSDTIVPQISLSNSNHSLDFSYESVSYGSSTTLTSDIILNEYTYSSEKTLSTDIKTEILTLGYKYKFKYAKIGIDLYSYDNTIDIQDESKEAPYVLIYSKFTFPSLVIDGTYKKNRYLFLYRYDYGVSGDITYQSYSLGIGREFDFIKNSSFSLGYESKKFKIDDDTYDSKSEYSGIYLKYSKTF